MVLKYQWSLEFNYNLAEYDIVATDLFNDETMLKLRGFKVNSDGSITLFGLDLDDQFRDNFKKLFELTAEKIASSLDSIKYHFISFDPKENKIDPSVESGDFVFLDYITGTYKPARSCTKKYDKAVGIYLKESSNKDFIIHSGIINFDDPKWIISDKRENLKNLEPGTSYYLADNCTETNLIDPNPEEKVIDPGAISSRFYPGVVRVGYAIDRNSLFIGVDYSSEIDSQNLLELFGDKDRFALRYKDFYNYYKLIASYQFYNDLNSSLGDNKTKLTDKVNAVNDVIDSLKDDLDTYKNNYLTDKNNYLTYNTKIDYKNNYKSIYSKYNRKVFIPINNLYDSEIISNVHSNVKDINLKISNIYTASKKNYDNLCTIDAFKGNIKILYNNSLVYFKELKDVLKYFEELISASTDSSGTLKNKEQKIQEILSKYLDKSTNKTLTDNSLSNYLNDTGYLKKTIDNILSKIDSLYIELSNLAKYATYETSIRKDTSQISINSISNENYWNTSKSLLSTDVDGSTDTYNYPTSKVKCDATDKTNTFCEKRVLLSSITKNNNNVSNNIYKDDSNDYYEKFKQNISDLISSLDFIDTIYKSILFIYDYIYTFKNTINIYDVYHKEITYDTISDELSNINTYKENFKTLYKNLIDSKKQYDLTGITLYNNQIMHDDLIDASNNLNSDGIDNGEDINKISEALLEAQNNLGVDLDENRKIESIFYINDHQRTIYNYTYITQRLRIKLYERKIVSDRINIINSKIEKVSNLPVIDYGDFKKLNDLLASYLSVKKQLDFEIETLIQEYNLIRTTKLGLEPLIEGIDSPDDVDKEGYSVSDLKCLELTE